MGVCEMTVKRTGLVLLDCTPGFVCAKWQWNARDCVTGLHDRRSRECSPVTPVECVSLSFRTPMCSRFYHIHIIYKRNWDDFCLVDLIYFVLHIFQIRNLLCIGLMNLGETCHSAALWRHAVWLNMYCDVTQCMNRLWIFITKPESPKGDSQT